MNLDRVIAVRTNKTVYRDGDKCIKVFDSDYSKADVLNEALNQARIEETGLNIPKVLEVCTIEGKWAIVSEYIKGKTLSQLMHAARTYLCFWLKGDLEDAEKYLNLFCELSGTDKRYVQKWMPIVAASQSVKGNAHEREFLLSWANVVDYE